MLVERGDGDAGGHGLLLHEFANLEGVFAVGTLDEGVLLADGGLLAALATVLLLYDPLVLADDLLPVKVIKIDKQMLQFILLLVSL